MDTKRRELLQTGSLALLAGLLFCPSTFRAAAQDATDDLASKPSLHEIIVSHADDDNRLQLYRIKDDGSSTRQITDSRDDCMMPAWSPDGEKIVYAQQSDKGLDLWLISADGKNARASQSPEETSSHLGCLIPSTSCGWFSHRVRTRPRRANCKS